MNDFLHYNKILVNLDDQYKIVFTTPWGNFCWKVMPFRFKNPRATYEYAMTTMVYGLIYKYIEIYVDNVLINYNKNKYHLA